MRGRCDRLANCLFGSVSFAKHSELLPSSGLPVAAAQREETGLKSSRIVQGLAFVAIAVASAARAEDIPVGVSAGLTGYIASADQLWVEGVKLGADLINQKGGVLGDKLKIFVEDNRSEPQEAMTSHNKLMSSDHVRVFLTGCLSAGAFASAPVVVRRQIPMINCAILPNGAALVPWIFSLNPPATYEVTLRLSYLRKKGLKKFGILVDPGHYAQLQAGLAHEIAANYGLEVVGTEKYQQTDSDLAVSIKKLQSVGAQAILKMGNGASTLTAARAIRELGLNLPLLSSADDYAMFVEVAKVLGKDFFFSASRPQVFDALPDSDPTKKTIGKFIIAWRSKFGDKDPTFAARGYDAVHILAAAIENAKSSESVKIRDAVEKLHKFQGVAETYSFDTNHTGVDGNGFVLSQIIDGKLTIENDQ
jgi:branched-chain amino acid transport system substrate-binding protein